MADCFVFIVSMAVSVIHIICRNLNKLPLLKKYLAVVKLEVHMKLAGIKLRLETFTSYSYRRHSLRE